MRPHSQHLDTSPSFTVRSHFHPYDLHVQCESNLVIATSHAPTPPLQTLILSTLTTSHLTHFVYDLAMTASLPIHLRHQLGTKVAPLSAMKVPVHLPMYINLASRSLRCRGACLSACDYVMWMAPVTS